MIRGELERKEMRRKEKQVKEGRKRGRVENVVRFWVYIIMTAGLCAPMCGKLFIKSN